MNPISGVFNNREIAIGIWMLLFAGWVAVKMDKTSINAVIKDFLSAPIVISVMLMGTYIALMVRTLSRLGFWDISDLKDTIFWSLGVAFVLLMDVNSARREEAYFQKLIIDNIKLVLILEFVIEIYVLDLWIELILFPTILLISILKQISETNNAYKSVAALTNALLIIIGCSLIIYAGLNLGGDLTGFFTIANLRNFALTPLLTFMFLPFIYFAALYAEFQQIFIHVRKQNKDRKLVQHAIWKILLKFHINLGQLTRWSKRVGILRFENEEQVFEALRR